MFSRCYNLEKISLNNLFTKNIKDMSNLFEDCYALKTLEINDELFITSNVTLMNNMFTNCKALEKIDLNKKDFNSVKNLSKIFYGCENLSEINLPLINSGNLLDMSHMFYGCKNLRNGFKQFQNAEFTKGESYVL